MFIFVGEIYTVMKTQFKCDVCRGLVEKIPYCGNCETPLANSTKVGYVFAMQPIKGWL